jgi:RHS repeat-associated protein
MNQRLTAFARRAVLATALLAALPLAAQTDSVYTDDFQSYGTQKNPAGWVDTSIGSSKPEAGGLYKTWPDPIQGKGTNVVYGTKQASGKPDATNNPRIGTFSTYTTKTFSGSGRFEYRGRFLRTSTDARIGLTFFSSYPEKDAYYLIGLWQSPAGLTMQLFGFGGPAPTGTLDSKFTPDINRWYDFLIQSDDSNGKTAIRAKFWLDTNPEPSAWNIDAADSSSGRLTTGRIGIWAAVKGEVYVDDLNVKSPVDHTPPTIAITESGQTLADGTRFNHAPKPVITVTDDLTPAAGINVTAQLDGQPFVSGTAVTGQGNHTLAVHAVDAVGNASDATVHFFVDTIPPAVTVVSPLNNANSASDVTIVLQVSDASLPYHVTATLDGAAYDISKAVTTEGRHTLALTVADDVGLTTVVPPITFTIDKSDPVVVLKEGNNVFPASGFVFDRDVAIHADVQDLTATVTKLTLDGAPYVENTPVTAECDHTIAGTVTDAVGHTVTIAPRAFQIDKAAPVVTLSESGAPLQTYYDRAVTPAIKVEDCSDTKVSATINGAPYAFGTALTAEKKYTLAGTVTDAVNHSTSFGPIDFFVDLTPPQVTLTANGSPFPPAGTVFDANVAADVTVSDLSPVKTAVTLDGQSVALPLTISDEKAHKLTAVVTDSVGKSTTATADFVIDKTPPSVDVQESGSSLADGRYFNRKVTPVIVVSDSTATTTSATLDGQPYTSGTDVTAEGTHTLAGTVTDAAKHTVPIGPLTFTIDTTNPAGVFKEGDADFPNGKSLNRDVTARVAVTDASPVTVTILLDGQPYTAGAAITAEQSHTLTATLVDKAGNQGVVPPVTFGIDRTPPTVALLANGSAFPADYVFGKDIAADVRVEDASPVTTTGALDGNAITFPFTITAEGQHTITATSVDAAGLSTTTPAIHFTLDKTPPSVVVLENGSEAVPNKVFGVDVTVTFNVDQGVSQRTVSATLDGAAYTPGTPITSERVHTIAGTVTSAAGLSSPIPATVFTIDKTKPTVKLKNRDQDFPPSGFYFNSDVVPVVACTDNLTHCTPKLVLDGNEVKNNDPITAEGAHTLTVSGTDEAGNTTTLDPVAFTIDKTPPAVTVTSHTDGQIVTQPQAVIAGGTDDAVTINVNGVAAGIDFDAKTYKTPSALPLLEGENIIAVTGIDRAGNPGTKSIRLILDTRNPSLVVASPAAGACITDNDLVVSGSVTDPNINSVAVTVGSNTVSNALDATKQGFRATFAAIAEGPQTIVVVATDTQGHRTQATLSVFVDRGAPAIEVLADNAPFTAKILNHPVALTYRVHDVDANALVSATADGAPFVSGATIGGEGAHRLDVLAADCAGHQSSVSLAFTIDTTPPAIGSVVPANGSTIAAAPQAITGTVSGDAVRVELEGTSVAATPTATGDFTLTGATVRDGANAFTIRATDAAGNVARLAYTFTVKSQAPKVDILESGAPLADGATFNRPVSPHVVSDDLDATITALLNGATYDGQPVRGDGRYTIEGRATDKLNHTGSATRTFTIDMTPPVVHITAPAPGDLAGNRVDVSGTAGDAVSVTVNGVAAQLAAGTFTAHGVPLDIGPNTITAAAADAAGNVGRDSVLVNVLGTGPAIIITEPADGALTNRPRVDVAGRVLSPTSDGTVTVGSAKVSVDSVGNFRLLGYQLAEGDNTIRVSATGANLQTASTSIKITADFTPPVLTVLASDQPLLDNAQFPQSVTLTLRASDNRGTIKATTLALDGALQTPPVSVTAQGGHVLTATATDPAGNETRVERTFFIGNTTAGSQGCRIDATDPADGAVIAASTVTVAGRAPGAATVTVNGVKANVADASFAASVDLPAEGANAITVQCADAGGLTATRTLTLTRVTGNPSVDITSPAEGFTTGDAKITVSGTVSADVATVDVNGLPATINGTTFSVANVTLANGLNTLVAHARNKAGRAAADSVRVRAVQTAPDLAITAPLSDYQTGDTKVTLSGTWSNLDPATIAVSGQSGTAPQVQIAKASDTTGSFTIADLPLAAGTQTLTVTGRNALNANATSSVKVTVTAGAPYISITSPADNAYLPGDQPIAVTGAFGGANGARIDINGTTATLSGASYSGSTPFSTSGDVTPVVARLTDANNNGAFAAVRVNRLVAPFAIKEAFPAANAQEVDAGVIVLLSFNAPLDLTTLNAVTLKASDGTSVTGTTLVDDTILAFAPSALLQSGTTYTINVATTLKNAAGMPLAQAFSSSFTVASSAPAKPSLDAIGAVDCAKPLTITGTATPLARVRMDAGTLTLSTTADAAGKFSFTYPFNGQSGWQVARVRVVGSDGSLSVPAEASFLFDCAAPQVVGASYDRNVNQLTISFSKAVDPTTLVVGSTIVIGTSSGTVTVSGTNAVVTPADDLRSATFTLTVTQGVKDTSGNPLVASYSQTFSASGDDQPPAPGDGSGFISGEVYDATTGRPLAGANVTIVVPATAFSKTPGTLSTNGGRYTIIGTPQTSGTHKVASNSLHVAVNATTETRGRYTMPLPEGAHTIQATAPGYTTVWRQIVVPAGAGVVPIDIRLTKRGDVKTSDGASSVSLATGGDTVITRKVQAVVPAGAVPSGSQVSLTAVGAQSLAGLLPLGWSPLASAEIAVTDASGNAQPHATLGTAQLTFTLPSADVSAANQVLSLVQYDDDRDEWRVIAPILSGTNDQWSAAVATSGAYAVVYPDKAPLAQPPAAASGATLQAAASTCNPCELVKKSFDADPKTILPNGRTVATLQIVSGPNTNFPSGTAVQAYVAEELHLPGGTTLVDPPFATDVLLYRNLSGDTGIGQFHLAPSAQATKVILSDGVDHIQILQYPGRLDRGTLIGAEGGRVPGDENVAVEIPSSATTVELHASVSSLSSSDLASYGTIAGFRVVGGFALTMSRAQTPPAQDLDGDGQPDPVPPVTLSRPARATVAVDTTKLPGASSLVLLAEVVDHPVWGRIVRLADPMTAIDTPTAGVTAIRYTTRAIDPAQLPVDGVIREGRYLVLAAEAPVAWATGAVRAGAGGVYLADARMTSIALPANTLLGVADSTRNTGVFAVPVAATPAAGFALQPKHAATGDGAPITSATAPAPDTVVKLGDVVLTPQSPVLVSTSPANGATIDLAQPVVITMTFSAPIDAASAANAISVVSSANTALPGTVSVSGATVTFTPSRPLVASTQYTVTIQWTLRGTNGAPLGTSASFGFSTNAIPTNANIDPLKVHITMPDNGVSRIYGDPGALPGGWRAVPVRLGNDFITRYQSDVAADGSFSMQAGNGPDASDRITLDDVIDLRVINTAGNVAAVIRLTPFVTADGKGFVAPAGVTTTFKSIEGVTVTVPAGAFDEAKLITVSTAPNNDAFNGVPNVASELTLYRTVNLTFDGEAKARIDVSFPINGLDASRSYYLGWLGQSVWGPRVAVVDTLRVDGASFTTSFPPDAAAKKTIAAANHGKGVTTNAGLTDMQIKSCLVGVTRQGSYALMDWTAAYPGGGLGWAVTWGIAAEVDLMSDIFQSIYLPDFAFSSRHDCAAMPIVKGKAFTLTGVDPSTGMVAFKTSYDPIPITDPAVVSIPSPDPDKRGPYPVFGTPYRIETVDFSGVKYTGRGYQLEYQENPPSNNKILLEPISGIAADQRIPEKAKIQIYNVTKSRWSARETVDAQGQFPMTAVFGDRGDQLVVYISTTDISAETKMNVVFSEPIDVGSIPAGTSATDEAKLIDAHLHQTLRFEKVVDSVPSDITKDATFSVDSQNRRVWIAMPAPLSSGATYRLTMLHDQFKDTSNNFLAEVHDPTNGTLVGDPAQDVVLEFKVRENPTDPLTSFTLQARTDFPGGQLRDLAQSGNLAFASALDAGLLVYDLSDPNALKDDPSSGKPKPYSLVPARWTDPNTGALLPGANGFDQYWGVTTDQHNRVFGAGFNASFGAVRVYKIEDFVNAHNHNNGDQCTGFIDPASLSAGNQHLKMANCRFYGSTIVGWRPGWSVNMPLSTNMVLTDYPEAYPRKLQIATQDDTKKYKDLDTLASPTTQTSDNVFVEQKTELGASGSGNFRFNVRVKPLVYAGSSMSAADKAGFLVERITLVNNDLDLRWSVDKYLGEDALFTGIIGRKGDHFTILRNQTTYAIVTMLGYGISVYDMRAVESNDIGIQCAFDAAFGAAHANFCQYVVSGHPRALEKIVNTRGDGKCDGTPPPNLAPDAIPDIQFSAESLGMMPGHADPTNPSATLYDELKMYGLDARRGVLDLKYKLPTDGTQPVTACATRAPSGLVFRNPQTGAVLVPRLQEIKTAVDGSSAMPPRFNAQTLFHWEVSAAQNATGLRGSVPGSAVSRDYLLIAAGSYGMLVVEIAGTKPPNGPGYDTLEAGNLADIVWFASGCYAIRVIPKTNLAAVLDGKGHVLIVDLSNLDQRWVTPNPNPSQPAQRIDDNAPFPLTHNALMATPAAGEIGVDDARVIYKSPYTYTTGVIPPIVDPSTGLAFGGDSVTPNMRTAALFDPPVEVVADLGKGLEPITGIVPLGVEPPASTSSYPAGSLAAFRIRVTLPGSIAKALDSDPQHQKLQFAVESERVIGALTEQTPAGTPPSHLRRSKRDGTDETRPTDLVFKHEIQIDSSIDVDAQFRHESAYNRLVSPWIVAIADPRASEHVVGDSATKKALGCLSCDRPTALHNIDETGGVYELFTNGRTIAIRPDSNTPSTAMSDALKGVYQYLGKNGRLELHIPTTMADTVRGAPITVAAQAPPVANGALSDTIYVHSGEVEVNATDMIVQGRAGNDIAVTRTHRSRTIGSTALGMNWEAPFLRRLRQLPNGNVEYRDGMGEVWTFTPDTSTPSSSTPTAATTLDQQFGTKIRYVSPKGLYLKLSRNESGWMLFDREWRIARFDNYGRLTSISDEFWKKKDPSAPPPPPPPPGTPPAPPAGEVGNTTFYTYDAGGRLTKIVDSVNRETTLEYWPENTAPNAADYNCTALGDRNTPCKYAGLLSKISDWRGRDAIFEYDKNGRLIGVQQPKVEGPDGTAIDNKITFKTGDTRPRIRYDYESPAAPSLTEPLQSATYTKFMNVSGNLHQIFEAAENAPTVTSPRPRVRFEYYDMPGNVDHDDRLHFEYWPCGDFDGTTCAETKATLDYNGNTATVTDMLGQQRDYVIADLTAPVVPPATAPDPQQNRFKHIQTETVSAVPTMDKTAPLSVAYNDTATDTNLVTTYNDFDVEGGVHIVTLPNGTKVTYDTLPAKNGAPGRILDKITEERGSEKRVTRYTYDATAYPNAVNTPVKIGRSSDGTAFADRDAQSPSRERKTVQTRDPDPNVKTKTETTFDDYGRPNKVEQRADDPNVGSGTLVEQHIITYKDQSSASDLEKGRTDEVTSKDAAGANVLQTQFSYADDNTNGQQITAYDAKRNVYTHSFYDAQGRPIHTQVTQGNTTLQETWTGYDASGRVIYTAHLQSPYGRVESFYTLDPLGRTVSVTTKKNHVIDTDTDVLVSKKYSVSAHTVTTLDAALTAGSALAQTIATLDKLGRTKSTTRSAVASTSSAPPESAAFAYDSTGQLAFSSDTVRSASYTLHDAFGRPSVTSGADKLQTKTDYDAWDQVKEQQVLGTDGTTVLAHAKQKFSDAGHIISRNEQVDGSRFRQTFSTWLDGGKKTGSRIGAASGLDADITGAARATEQTNDGAGRLLDETYGKATGTTGSIATADIIHKRTLENYVGDVPQQTTDIYPLRGGATVTTGVVLDGLDRIHQSTVGASGPSITGYTTTTDYDEAGNVIGVTPPGNINVVTRKLDGRGLPYEEKRGNDTVTRKYDERGILRSYIDESLKETKYDVDDLGRVVRITYPDTPLTTTEQFDYEPATGLLRAHKDRKDVWLSYIYDEGGRTTEIHKGEDPTSPLSPLLTRFEYDATSKRLLRIANKDSAIEYDGYDFLGRPTKTTTYRYANGTGLETATLNRQVLDVHVQSHTWSIFDGERSNWTMPVTGATGGTSNASPWLTSITETRDESTNVVSLVAGSTTITATPGGVGQILTRTRPSGITSTYSYADNAIPSPMAGVPGEPQWGALRKVETAVAGATLAGSEIFHDDSQRIGLSNDLAFTSRKSRWTYDVRGRVNTTKLLVPQSLLNVATPVADHHTEATFRDLRDTAGLLSAADVSQLGNALALKAEPPKWTAGETPAHEITNRTFYLNGSPLTPSQIFQFDGGRRTSDGTWTSSFDEFGRLLSVESSDRKIEYTYDPRGRIIGRTAYQKSGGSTTVETRTFVLTGDGLPAQTTWVWDPVVDRLIAVYETGKSTPAPGTTTPPPAEAGLVRQYLHGDRGYDDPVEVLIAPQAGATPVKYYPVFDEAGTDSLQAVLDKDGNVVERVLYGDSYGDAPRYLQGPSVDKITFASDASGAVDVRIRASETVKQMTVANGVRLVALKSDGSVAATSPVPATLDADQTTIHWHFGAGDWTSFTSNGATQVQVAVTSTLRATSWGDVPFASVPDFARKLYPASSDGNAPIIITNSLTTLNSLSGSGNEEPLYEIKSLYMSGFEYSKTKLLTGFQALPFNEPANGLIFARARWYDPSTGSWLTPDPMGYADASSLYAFAAGDPVNLRDPLGLGEEQSARAGEAIARSISPASARESAERKRAIKDWALNKLRPRPAQPAITLMMLFAKGYVVNYTMRKQGLVEGAKVALREFGPYLPFWSSFDSAQAASNEEVAHHYYEATMHRLDTGFGFASDTLLVVTLSEGLQGPSPNATLYNARTSRAVAEAVVKNFDPAHLSPNARFGPGLYLAEETETAAAEVDFHGKANGTPATHIIEYEVDMSKAKVLDLTDPKIAEKWGYEPSPSTDYSASKALAERAKQAGFNVIKYESLRVPGSMNYVVVEDFDALLKPKQILERQ